MPRILHQLLVAAAICALSKGSIADASISHATDEFVVCLVGAGVLPRLLQTPASPSYFTSLLSSVRNLRYVTPGTPRPLAIVAATDAVHVQSAVRCGRRHGVRIRVRSGGHDYEGLSYASLDPSERFAVLDLAALRDVRVDSVRAEAWADSGATLGEVYYAVAAASSVLAFPAGICPTVGVGGHLIGGGFGMLMRRYGLAVDNVIDAVLVDADGRLLNRATMGEDLFWAISGGGGQSFGVVLSWKLRLVRVPEIVTVFTVRRSIRQSASDLITKWQAIAPALPRDLMLRVVVENQHAQFEALFLGRCSRLLAHMRAHFPDLGVTQPDCEEISWIQSTVYFAFYSSSKPLELLLDRSGDTDRYVKAKSDYVQEPIPRHVWDSTWSWLEKPEAGLLILDPYGGRMDSVSSSATPFPHRKGNLYNIQYYSYWFENGTAALEKRMSWIGGLYEEMEPYVSKNPRTGYVNYRDLDLGTNEGSFGSLGTRNNFQLEWFTNLYSLDKSELFLASVLRNRTDMKSEDSVTRYTKARIWGKKYFKDNFERLAAVKAMVDPHDFFRNEQSIPPLPAAKGLRSI